MGDFAAKFQNDPSGNLLAIIVLLLMVGSVLGVLFYFFSNNNNPPRRWLNWLVPLLALAGIGVAIYLTYIETTNTQAICGPIGDCNSVQQSPYSKILGVIPVGLLGAIGYLAIIIAWIINLFLSDHSKKYAWLAIWGMAWFGVIFSIYLTFLEPFVIGATCIWCISSAILITALLWVTTPFTKYYLQEPEDEEDYIEVEGLS